jgi:hypothetical protein
MALEIRKAQRAKVKLKMAIEGPSGSGKTYSSLLIAKGLVPGGRVLVIDTENESASLYAHLYDFDTIDLKPPYSPERYVEGVNMAVRDGYDVLIIDSASHEWIGKGGILEAHDLMPGNSWTNWARVNPRHDAFVYALLQSPIHIIACLRSKEKYIQEEVNGKQKVRKVGAEAVQRDGLNYEFSTVLTMDISHQAMSTKDRTGLFSEKWFTPDEETGRCIAEFLNQGVVRQQPAESIVPVPAAPPATTATPTAAVDMAVVAQIWESYVELCGQQDHAINAIKKVTGGRGSKDLLPTDIDALRADIERRRTENANLSLRADPAFQDPEMDEELF